MNSIRFYKKPWFIAAVVILVLGALFGGGSKKDENKSVDAKPEETETRIIETLVTLSYEIITEQANEYGKEVVMNEDADSKEEFITYYNFPAGDYIVENLGDNATQFSIHEGLVNKETGYNEYDGTGDVVMVNKGESKDINIPDGWCIVVTEPAHIRFTKK